MKDRLVTNKKKLKLDSAKSLKKLETYGVAFLLGKIAA